MNRHARPRPKSRKVVIWSTVAAASLATVVGAGIASAQSGWAVHSGVDADGHTADWPDPIPTVKVPAPASQSASQFASEPAPDPAAVPAPPSPTEAPGPTAAPSEEPTEDVPPEVVPDEPTPEPTDPDDGSQPVGPRPRP